MGSKLVFALVTGALVFGLAGGASAASFFPTTLSQNTTGFADLNFIGAPDDTFIGLGGKNVEYDLGQSRVINGPGGDFNVYEVDYGSPEPNSITVHVSLDGVTYTDVTSSRAAGVRISGDSAHGNNNFFYSYDLGALSYARYILIDGNGTGAAGGTNAFDLDAVGIIHGAPVPIPAAAWLLGTGLAGLAGIRRKRKNQA